MEDCHILYTILVWMEGDEGREDEKIVTYYTLFLVYSINLPFYSFHILLSPYVPNIPLIIRGVTEGEGPV